MKIVNHEGTSSFTYEKKNPENKDNENAILHLVFRKVEEEFQVFLKYFRFIFHHKASSKILNTNFQFHICIPVFKKLNQKLLYVEAEEFN